MLRWVRLLVVGNIVGVGAADLATSKSSTPRTTRLRCEYFVAQGGSDTHGDGSLDAPFATAKNALSAAAATTRQPQQHCKPGVVVSFRSGVYELDHTLEIAGPRLQGLHLRTFPADLDAGLPPAVISGGKSLPAHTADADGVYRTDLAALGVRESDRPERFFTLYVNGARRQRVRSKLLHWNHSISSHDPCKSCPMNRYGFVFSADTFDPAWDLTPSATASWLLVSFHQWATGVHTVRNIVAQNRTLFVNEPVYSKYAFDDNMAGAQRFYVENVLELPLADGQWRVLPNRTLEYRLLPSELAEQGAGTMLKVVVPSLKCLISINGTSGVSLRSLSLAHTEWELTSKVRGGWRDRLEALPADVPTKLVGNEGVAVRVGGSGPLPVETRIIQAWKADRLSIDNCTIRNGGASGLYVAHSHDVSIARSVWYDFGAAAIETAVTDGIMISDCRLARPGQVWQQGLGVGFGHCSNATITRCELVDHPSDGVSFSGVGLVHNNTLSYSLLHNFGQSGVLSRQSDETISDWGGIHTAHPNVTGVASHVHNNVFANFSSYSIGGYSLYFDFGSAGTNSSQNLAYNTGSGIFYNSNGECGGWPGSWQNLSDNIFAYDHWNPQDFNILVKWRTLAPQSVARRNIFYVASSVNDTGDFELFHDHSATQKQQWDNATWDYNVYYRERYSGVPFGNTWPKFGNLSSWRQQGKDTHSVLTSPRFVDADHADFRLSTGSPALALGFREWDHASVGPDCRPNGYAVGTVACDRAGCTYGRRC
jgi:hypothetical protein